MANGPRRREHLDLCEILMVLWSWFQLGQGERTPQSCSVGEDHSVDPSVSRLVIGLYTGIF